MSSNHQVLMVRKCEVTQDEKSMRLMMSKLTDHRKSNMPGLKVKRHDTDNSARTTRGRENGLDATRLPLGKITPDSFSQEQTPWNGQGREDRTGCQVAAELVSSTLGSPPQFSPIHPIHCPTSLGYGRFFFAALRDYQGGKDKSNPNGVVLTGHKTSGRNDQLDQVGFRAHPGREYWTYPSLYCVLDAVELFPGVFMRWYAHRTPTCRSLHRPSHRVSWQSSNLRMGNGVTLGFCKPFF
ncbi:hypothetical protein QBC35DRAFT_242351 [Podospora australis]|uniref:Uncharacterized protein n=1 Tax=Podospora australis TaxID=1536484 RepID=A0AAN6X170_9PEZI|nr:hypothetical protein QBC35DRAFT_242351 [Podospora australis]